MTDMCRRSRVQRCLIEVPAGLAVLAVNAGVCFDLIHC